MFILNLTISILPWDVKTPRASNKGTLEYDFWGKSFLLSYKHIMGHPGFPGFIVFVIIVTDSIRIGVPWSLLGSSEIKYVIEYRQREQ